MDDVELVEAARRGDRGAFAAIYDAYAPRIHALCTRLLNEPHTAADATQDTFVVAAQRLDQLRDPAKLRAWLYAIARNECTRHGRARGRLVPVEEVADMSTDEADDPGNRAAASDVAELLWAAAEGLDDRDKVLLELDLRHGLEGQELAEAAGIAPGQISMATGRMRERIERSLGALLVARRGRDDCPGLDAVLRGWDGTFSVLMRKRVARHVEHCEVCERKKAVLVAPLGSLAVAPFVLPPAHLREQVLGAIDRAVGGSGGSTSADAPGGSTSADAPGGEGGIAATGATVGGAERSLPALHEDWPGGFPPPRPATRGDRRRLLLPVAAVVVLLLLLVGGVALLGGAGSDGEDVATGPAPITAVGDDGGPGTSPTKASATSAGGATSTALGTSTTVAGQVTTTTAGSLGEPVDPNGQVVPTTDPPVAQPGPNPDQPPITLDPPDATVPPTAPNRPPSIGSTTRAPSTGTMQVAGCNPPNDERTIKVIVTDDRGVGSVALRWTGPGGSSGSVAMTRGGTTWTGILQGIPAAGDVTYRAVATDTNGAKAASPSATVTVDPCPG